MNIKVRNYLLHKISKDDYEISYSELDDIGLKYDSIQIAINENVYLQKINFFKSFKISFHDEKRDFDNRLLDQHINTQEVIMAISNYKLTPSKYEGFKAKRQAEVEWNKDLEKHLKKYFISVKRGNPTKQLEIDLDIGAGKVGIELKWADKINKNNPMNNVVGQIDGYFQNGNYEELFLVVAGLPELRQDSILLQLEKRIAKNANCKYLFIEIH